MKNFVLLLIILSMFGCTATQQQYALDSSKIAIESQVLKTQYASIEGLIRAKKDVFTDDEWRKLLNVDATIDMLIVRYDAIMTMQGSTLNVADVKFLWDMAATGYDQGREVITAHWDSFQPSTQILLNSFDRQAESLSDQIGELLNNPSNTNINQALVLIAGTLSVAIKMVSIGATML